MGVFGSWKVKTWPLFIPLALSIAAFVLSMIALFAGTGPQQQALEEYHMLSLNVSGFGQDLLPSSTENDPAQPSESSSGGFWDSLGDTLGDIGDDIQDAVTDQVNDVIGDLADEITDKLGISQWYSLHVMNWCQGDFAPNSSVVGAWYNTTNCTERAAGIRFNLTEILNHEISVGPLHFNTAEIPLPERVERAVEDLNSALFALFVLFVLGAALSGFSILLTLATIAFSVLWGRRNGHRRQAGHKKTIIGNAVFNFLAVVVLAVAAAIATVIARKASAEITDAGDEVGISANAGMKFIGLCWGAFGAMFLAFVFWSSLCCFPRVTYRKSRV
ncbi:actin cortical patch SUR7/pH-response regulator pali [Microdochium trichocladiopsis]|uniref:Actin cortical patch SUR7/pH-response regulator pali n=1 Tax=Microdochium trichocladiopsis TaxID=1682393 RepID=A0A9P8YCE7_9PEZI|nr:actin cortical patch SUR7/pH-response regulator pali [Microdochium trichocladiopsis]KAH7035484.1 actin cortical patch SUR7/pH-response regulator pali [Microdochium trichocladiopsis]